MSDDLIRRGDGGYLSIQDAVRMFATKDELLLMRDAVRVINDRLERLPTREEWNLRAKSDDDYRDESRADLNALKAARVPTWLISLIPSAIAIALAAWKH